MVKYDPPLYVFTSDKYLGCIPIWCHLFNKYWNAYREKKVTILGYSIPKYKNWQLPDNIKFVSLGKQQPAELWSNKIREYLLKKDFDHIQWCTEDSFLSYPVNFEAYDFLINELNDETVGRVALTNDFSEVTKPNKTVSVKNTHTESPFVLLEADKNAKARITGTWSIFSRDCFFEFMKPNTSPWEFEEYLDSDGKPRATNYRILGLNTEWPLRTTCSIRTTGRWQKNKENVFDRPLVLEPINEESDRSDGGRPFPKDSLLELRNLKFINTENVLSVNYEIVNVENYMLQHGNIKTPIAMESCHVPKGWGEEIIIENNEMYCGKILVFKKGCKFSMHYHMNKDETWWVEEGEFNYTFIDTETAYPTTIKLTPGWVVRQYPGQPHQLEALTEGRIFEVSTHHEDSDSYRVLPGDSQASVWDSIENFKKDEKLGDRHK